MADIISGKFSETEDDSVEELELKIKRHKRRVVTFVGIIAVIVVLVLCMIPTVLDGITYTGYDIVSSTSCDNSESTRYVSYRDGYVKYSNDGVSYYNGKTSAVWNQTISMQNPQIKICEDAVAVGDINGSKIFIFNEKGAIGSVDTSLAISQVEVSKQGLVAAVLEDNEANYINMYNTDGEKIYSVKTSLAGDGYPLDISISEDGTKLVASFLYVSGENVKTNVVFYNFSAVGQNETERVVGGFDHDSMIVGDVEFINNNTAVAIGENVVSIYTIKEYPKLSHKIEIDNEIQRVFFSDKYIGLILDNGQSGDSYKMQIYDTSGKKVCDTTFNMQYDTIQLDDKSVVMSNSAGFVVMNFKGKIIADMSAELPVEHILTSGSRGKYIMINSKYIQNIKLK